MRITASAVCSLSGPHDLYVKLTPLARKKTLPTSPPKRTGRPMTEASARRILESIRWPDGRPTCPFGEHHRVSWPKVGRDGLHRCAICKNDFTVTVHSRIWGTHLPLRVWLMAVETFQAFTTSGFKPVPRSEFARRLGISRVTAIGVLRLLEAAPSSKSRDTYLRFLLGTGVRPIRTKGTEKGSSIRAGRLKPMPQKAASTGGRKQGTRGSR